MKKKILVVDNNMVFLRLLGGYLEGKGYDVQTAEDGLAALAIMESFAPDVVFVDLVMPLIDGERMCRIVRKIPEYDSVILVVVTAVAAETQIDFASFGADACIAKGPFKGMQAHINTILELVDDDATLRLKKTIYGVNEVHERQVTRELIAVRRHFEIIVNNMEEGFLELTPGGSIVYANRAASEFLGVSEEKLLAASLVDHLPDNKRGALSAQIAGLGDKPVEFGADEALQVNDRLLSLRFVPFEDDGHRSLIVLVFDMSDRKHCDDEWRHKVAGLEQELERKNGDLAKANEEIVALRKQLS